MAKVSICSRGGQSTEMLVALRASQEKNQAGQFCQFIFFTVDSSLLQI